MGTISSVNDNMTYNIQVDGGYLHENVARYQINKKNNKMIAETPRRYHLPPAESCLEAALFQQDHLKLSMLCRLIDLR